METMTKSESLKLVNPILFGVIFTIIYGVTAYLPELLDLEFILFTDNLSPFMSIFFKFVSRFTLSGILWILALPLGLKLLKGISSHDFIISLRLLPKQLTTRNVTFGIVASLAFVSCVVLIALLLGVFNPNFSLLVDPDYENGLGWFIFIFALIPGIWEEIAFRGIILSLLLSKYSVRKAMIIDGFLFSLFHVFNFLILGQDLLSVLLQSFAAIFVGISLAYLVIKADSLLPAIIIHYSIDVTLFISGFIFNLTDNTSSSIFAIFSLIILPPLVIYLSTLIFEKYNLKIESG
ncbi:MAG: CPBP family intramembrane glutamic endopeptidase [Candidatus Hodarchaeales archaeon]|jgi:membrane protease YdiL (CAAX protease family)